VSLGSRVAMEKKLEQALNRVLGARIIEKDDVSAKMPDSGDLSGLGRHALKYYNSARDYLRQGDWAGYGRELEKLENILIQISNQPPGQE
jgi:hypothetical protein